MSGNDDILSPTPERPEDASTVLCDRPSSLDGMNIGLLSNTKKNSEHFLESVGDHLRDRGDITFSEVIFKPTATRPASEEVYEQLREYDCVLTAYGDCGSCSSWTIHDAIELERAGVPVVVFCSEEFTTLCQFEAESQSCPGLPIVPFEHPIADVDPNIVREERVTEALCDEVVSALTASPDELISRYKGRYTDDV